MSKKRSGQTPGYGPKRSGPSHRFRLMPKLKQLAKINWSQIFTDFYKSWRLVEVLIFADVLFTMLIVRSVKYTEIDWKTYMAQVSQIFESNRFNFSYKEITGPTGPLVYPAGHTYIFYILKKFTEEGTNLMMAQNIFSILYLAQLVLVYLIYSNKRVSQVPPYIFIIVCFTSYRIHSIYVLRLFNDTVAVLFAYASFYALLRKRYSLSAILYSLGVSVKMNILLYAPAFALIFYEEIGLKKSIKNAFIALAVQVTLAAPYLYTNPIGYLERAFDFNRVFLHEWTVNWRFLDESVFTSPTFFKVLLAGHVALLLIVYWSRILKCLLGNKFAFKVKRDDPILTLFIANFIGIAFSRSLHYQFYVWYYHSLPMLLWATKFSVPLKILILGCIEFAWNQYPSTTLSSLVLHTSHLLIMIGLLTRNLKIFARKTTSSETSEKVSVKGKQRSR